MDESGWRDPAGFHLIPLPYADDIRAAPIEKAARGLYVLILAKNRGWIPNILLASDKVKDAARAWIDKLSVKNGAYPPDSYPNPGERVSPGCFIRPRQC